MSSSHARTSDQSPHANNVSIRSVLSARPLGEAGAHNMTGQFWPITGGGAAAGCRLHLHNGRAAGFYRAPLQNSYLKTVVAEKIIKFLYSFSQKAFHGEYQ